MTQTAVLNVSINNDERFEEEDRLNADIFRQTLYTACAYLMAESTKTPTFIEPNGHYLTRQIIDELKEEYSKLISLFELTDIECDIEVEGLILVTILNLFDKYGLHITKEIFLTIYGNCCAKESNLNTATTYKNEYTQQELEDLEILRQIGIDAKRMPPLILNPNLKDHIVIGFINIRNYLQDKINDF